MCVTYRNDKKGINSSQAFVSSELLCITSGGVLAPQELVQLPALQRRFAESRTGLQELGAATQNRVEHLRSCFRSFYRFESGSRTFCSPKTNSGAVSIPASGPSQRHHIRSSLQSGPHLHRRTVPLSAVNCLEIPSCMRTVSGVCDS